MQETRKMAIYMLVFKVQFHTLSTVVRIATKGCDGWIIQYRLAYTEDCITFNNYLDVAGNNLVIHILAIVW